MKSDAPAPRGGGIPPALRQTFIYLVLFGGALVFGWPFLWMATTSVRLERELYREKPHLWPETPIPEPVSPYVDTRYTENINGPRMEEAIGDIRAMLRGPGFHWPGNLDREQLIEACAQALYKNVRDTLPPSAWNGSAAELRSLLRDHISGADILDMLGRLRRVLCLGQVSIDSYDLENQLLVPGSDVAAAFQASAPANVTLVQQNSGKSYAEVHYDLTRQKGFDLSQTFATTFPVTRLHRIQMSMRDDDSWNRLTLFVEMKGRLYKAERSHDLADALWSLGFWQEPGPDDSSTSKIHSWILLKPVASGPQFESDPYKLRIRVHVARASLLTAWQEKIWRNYQMTINYVPFWRYVATSTFIVLVSLVGTIFSCSLVAYSFARLEWPGRNFCFALMLATMMVPTQVTMIPYFLIIRSLGWYNTLYPLWIGHFFASAFSVFLLRQFLRGVPRDLEDAARIDGCGYWRIYWHIMLPMIRPTLAVIGIFTFIGAWNDFMGPLIYLSDQRLYPLSLGLYALAVSMHGTSTGAGSFGVVMAGSLLMTLPVILTFFFAQRYFLKGVAITGIKR